MSTKHLRGVDRLGAAEVPISSLRLATKFGREVAEQRSILVVLGAAGLGKTFAARTLCEQLPVATYVPVDYAMTSHAFLSRLLRELGGPVNHGLRGHLLEEAVIERLGSRRPLLVIDDANHLGRRLIAQFIYLQAYADFGLVLVGYRLDRLLHRHPELETRVARTVSFRRLRGAKLMEALAAYHPVLAATDPTVLREVDAHWARGCFRRWAAFLERALTAHAADIAAGVPRAVAGRVVGAISGSRFGIPANDEAA